MRLIAQRHSAIGSRADAIALNNVAARIRTGDFDAQGISRYEIARALGCSTDRRICIFRSRVGSADDRDTSSSIRHGSGTIGIGANAVSLDLHPRGAARAVTVDLDAILKVSRNQVACARNNSTNAVP